MVEIDTIYRAMCMRCADMRTMADKRAIEKWADNHLATCGKTESYSHNIFDNNLNGAAMDPHHQREARRIQ